MELEIFVANAIREKAYLLYDENTKKAICVDPGNNDTLIADFVKEKQLDLVYILLTHGHFDHIMGVKFLKEFGAKVVAHNDEDEILKNTQINGGAMYNMDVTVDADIFVTDGKVLKDAGFDIKVLHTPGHTKGGVCFLIESEDIVFTGDTLFRETIGRSDLYTGDFDTLISSINEKLFTLNDDMICFPGHGENTNIGFEKQCNPFFA